MTDRRRGDGSGGAPDDGFRPPSEPDDGPVPTATDRSADDGLPGPTWVPTNDVIGPTPDRQVLVVGDTPTGLALTSLLRAAGYEPVLAGATDLPTASRATFLSPAAMEVLGSLDADRRLLDGGVAVDAVAVGSARTDGPDDVRVERRHDDAERAPAVVVPRPLLYRTLDAGLPSEATALDRTVGAVSAGESGVAVRFEDGVREWFDLVVDAGAGSLRSRGPRADADRPDVVRQYEATVDRRTGRGIRDVWLPNGLIQWVPISVTGDTLVRLTTTAAGPGAAKRAVETAGRRPEVTVVPEFGAFELEQVHQARLPEAAVPQEWWGSGRIARCGRAACPAAPAAGVGASMGLTDALGLVSALTRAGTPVSEAVDGYAASRARRFDDFRRAARGADRTPRVPESASEPLQSLGTVRAMALDPFTGTTPGALWRTPSE